MGKQSVSSMTHITEVTMLEACALVRALDTEVEKLKRILEHAEEGPLLKMFMHELVAAKEARSKYSVIVQRLREVESR